MLRVTIDRRPWRLVTGVEVRESDWNNAKQDIRRSNPNYAQLNSKLQLCRKEVEDLYHELEKRHETVTMNLLKTAYEQNHVEYTFEE